MAHKRTFPASHLSGNHVLLMPTKADSNGRGTRLRPISHVTITAVSIDDYQTATKPDQHPNFVSSDQARIRHTRLYIPCSHSRKTRHWYRATSQYTRMQHYRVAFQSFVLDARLTCLITMTCQYISRSLRLLYFDDLRRFSCSFRLAVDATGLDSHLHA